MNGQFQRAGYTFTPTFDQTAQEPGPLWVAKDGQSHTFQPDLLDGRDDDTELAAFLDGVFAQLAGPTP